MPKPRRLPTIKKPVSIDIPSGSLRVWWIPQVPGPRFFVPVADIAQAKLVLTALARYDLFQLEHRIKPDFANAGGLEVFEGGAWCEWNNADGEDIDNVMHQERP